MIKYVEISSLSAPNANLHKAQQQKQKKKSVKERKRGEGREREREGEQFVVARAKHTRTYIDTDADTVGEIQLEMLGRCWGDAACIYVCMYVYRRNRTYRYNRYLCCGG